VRTSAGGRKPGAVLCVVVRDVVGCVAGLDVTLRGRAVPPDGERSCGATVPPDGERSRSPGEPVRETAGELPEPRPSVERGTPLDSVIVRGA
jgi:hypothetical protein